MSAEQEVECAGEQESFVERAALNVNLKDS